MSINDSPAPRLLMVWEGLIALPSKEREFDETDTLMRLYPTRALNGWVTDARMSARLRDAWDHSAYVMDAITFFGKRAADAIEQRLRSEHAAIDQMLYADDPRLLDEMSIEHFGVYHGADAYKGLLGDAEIYLWNPDNFDLPN